MTTPNNKTKPINSLASKGKEFKLLPNNISCILFKDEEIEENVNVINAPKKFMGDKPVYPEGYFVSVSRVLFQ